MAQAKLSTDKQSFSELPSAFKALVGVLCVLVIGVIYYVAVHSGLDSTLKRERLTYNNLIEQERQASQRRAEYERLAAELDARAVLDAENRAVLPRNEQEGRLLRELNGAAAGAALSVESTEPQPSLRSQHYCEHPINLEVEGRYHEVGRFFNEVARLPRAVSMESISVRVSNDDRRDATETEHGPPVLEVSMTATAYSQLPEEGAGGC